LHRQIGQLKVENDNLSRKLGKRPFCGSRGMRDHLRRLGCKETLDRFLSAMRAIAKEAQSNPDLLHQAPCNPKLERLDETLATRKPILRSPSDKKCTF
jgi:hypothetical protein